MISELGPDQLRAVLDQRPPRPLAGPQAAVAVIFRTGTNGTELLFIQRASKSGDPWSGHMAFPGGRVDPGDADTFAAAERETLEEVGLDLTSAARIGSLDDSDGGLGRNNLRSVSPHGYWLDGERPNLVNNYEVADSLWVPMTELANRERYIDYYWPKADSHWPGIQLDVPEQVIWGMTLRFLANLFERLDTPFIELDGPRLR